MMFLKKAMAFLKKDLLNELSYKFAFLMQIFGIFLSVTMFYFSFTVVLQHVLALSGSIRRQLFCLCAYRDCLFKLYGDFAEQHVKQNP